MIEDYLNFHLDLDERIAAFKNRKQYSCEIEVTNRCNLACRYCYVSANKSNLDLDEDVIIKIIDELWDYGIKEIGWIGGEPLLYGALWNLMRYVKSNTQMRNVLYTNGILLEKYTKYILAMVDRVVVHLDSIEGVTWQAGQNKPCNDGNLQIMRGINTIVKNGFNSSKIIISIPLTLETCDTVSDTMKWARDAGIRFINLIPLTGIGRGKDENFIRPIQLKEALMRRASVLKLPFLLKLGISEYCKQFQLTDFTIAYNGDVLRYIDDYRPVANIKDGSLKEILDVCADDLRLEEWVSGDTLNNKADVCKDCEYCKYCFGNPVSRPNPIIGKPDGDCWKVSHE